MATKGNALNGKIKVAIPITALIAALASAYLSIDARVDSTETQCVVLRQQQRSLKETFSGLEARLQRIEDKLDALILSLKSEK